MVEIKRQEETWDWVQSGGVKVDNLALECLLYTYIY
jgi:hypothetical protein